MRQVLLGLLGGCAAEAACAEEYNFAAVIKGTWQEQTIIQCDGLRISGRVPKRCTLLERAVAFPNHQMPQRSNVYLGVACAAGHPIEFHPNGTLAECVLDVEQPVDVTGLGFTRPLGTARALCASTRMAGWSASSLQIQPK